MRVIAVGDEGCGYHRGGRTFEIKGEPSIGDRPSLTGDGQTVRMLLDFNAQTIIFTANGAPCPGLI